MHEATRERLIPQTESAPYRRIRSRSSALRLPQSHPDKQLLQALSPIPQYCHTQGC
jgi:hypothetical protein